MSPQTIRVSFARIEAQQLESLASQLAELVHDPDAATDPAIARLTPAAYRDDPAAAADFAALTSGDLLARRAADAQSVRTSLRGALARDGLNTAQAPLEISIAQDDVDPWLRTLTALRLILATRLGVVDGDPVDDDAPTVGVYEWLGYRLELLIEAADELLAD